MRSIKLILLAAMITILPTTAQVTFGVRAGGAYSSIIQIVEDTHRAGARFGFSVAGLADIPLYKGLSLRPELAFVNQGGSFISDFEIEGAWNVYNKCNYYSLQIPLNLAYTFKMEDVRLGFFVGPALDFSLFGKIKTQNQNVDISFGQKEQNDLKSFDLGVNLGLRVDYAEYFFSIGAMCGTLDRRSVKYEGESSIFQNNVTLSLGYMFR